MLVIPALDIIDGKCVRLTKGDYDTRKEYSANPLEVAKTFEDAGLKRIHLVDLEGAKGGGIKNLATLERLAAGTSLVIDFGGGIKTRDALLSAFNAGAAYVTCGSIAVKNREETVSFIEEFGEKIILGADCQNKKIKTPGRLEESGIDVFSFKNFYMEKGVRECISTDISKDGMLAGPAFPLYEELMSKFPSLKLIASGGVSNADDLRKLSKLNVYGTIVGKAFYEGKITLKEMGDINNAG